ncbi:MAG: hypothetical protein ABIN36_13730 [Ferruginibacter sp.]
MKTALKEYGLKNIDRNDVDCWDQKAITHHATMLHWYSAKCQKSKPRESRRLSVTYKLWGDIVEQTHKENEWVIEYSPYKKEDITEEEFNELATAWKRQTAHFSTMYHKLNNSNYLKIIGSGKPAVPFILKDLQKNPELWHEALYFITKDNPVELKDLNDIIKVQQGWLKWGKEQRII